MSGLVGDVRRNEEGLEGLPNACCCAIGVLVLYRSRVVSAERKVYEQNRC